MPKGFLVKRSKKAGPVSYRPRDENEPTPKFVPSPGPQVFRAANLPPVFVQRTPYFGGQPESFYPISFSPTRPDSEGYANQHPSSDSKIQTSAGSPSQPELLLEPVLGGFALNGSPVSPSLPEMTTKVESACPPTALKRPAISSNSKSNQSTSKKRKSTASPQERKVINRDAVTTSPVLGLRIKEDHEDDPKEVPSGNSSLGEFVCQLCKQRYLDPLSLAHHKCSRIVRVEYRCTECDKTFSCPANLASHRRWHKPKGEENQPHPSAGSSAAVQSEHSDSGSEEDAQFGCAQCGKKFRRQAYLRKHLALHERKAAGLRQDLNLGNQIEPINLVKEEVSAKFLMATCPTKSESFPCRFCGENFFSSPGLTRHINKHHPTETRQMILLTQSI